MGTNYYIAGTGEHIGKTSAAGPYCFRCDLSLCKGGKSRVHNDGQGWYETCPGCGEPLVSPGKNVQRTCSFTWAIDPIRLEDACREAREAGCRCCGQAVGENLVIDEYGRGQTLKTFLAWVLPLPIQFHESIGTDFS